MSAFDRWFKSMILRWRVENYQRQQLQTALRERSRSEHLERRASGIKDAVPAM